MIARFWNQPSRAYRDFQLVYGGLGLHFFFPALGYLLSPETAMASFTKLGTLLGAGAYPFTEQSMLWRVLAGTNVLTLAFLCFFIQADVRRHWPALYPLVFMKGTTAAGFFIAFVTTRYPAFLAAAFWDGLNCGFFVHFARGARDAAVADEGALVPRPLGARVS